MPLPLVAKEKILLYGGSNSGKTHAALEFALHTIESGHRAFIMDSDDGASKLILEMPEFAPLISAYDSGKLGLQTVYNWDDTNKAADIFLNKFKPVRGDVFVHEMVGYLYDWAQAKYAGDVRKGKSVAEVELEQAKEKGRVQFGGFDGRSDWPVIKDLYLETLMEPAFRAPSHTIWIAGAKDITPDTNESLKAMYSGVGSVRGIRPEGEKNITHQMDTVIFLDYDHQSGDRTFKVTKDRGVRKWREETGYEHLFEMYYDLNSLPYPWTNGKK